MKITMPQERREEVKEARTLCDDYKSVKAQKKDVKRRLRHIREGWRNGVVGVEGPED